MGIHRDPEAKTFDSKFHLEKVADYVKEFDESGKDRDLWCYDAFEGKGGVGSDEVVPGASVQAGRQTFL